MDHGTGAAAAAQPSPEDLEDQQFEKFASHLWHDDAEFQNGLQALLGWEKKQYQVDGVNRLWKREKYVDIAHGETNVLNAKVFYYER
jgi:hypothetical protein